MSTGEKIKNFRKQQNKTLKELSAETGLSIGYLSLVERNQTSLTLASLESISEALGISPSVFLNVPQPSENYVVHRESRKPFKMDGEDNAVYYSLEVTSPDGQLQLGPMIKTLLPGETRDERALYTHQNEEFGYVMEGILTLFVNDKEYRLYPGDCFHFHSTIPHALANYTNNVVSILYVLQNKLSV